MLGTRYLSSASLIIKRLTQVKSEHMPYKTYKEQILEHIWHLQSNDLDVEEIMIDSDWVRCHQIGETRGRGELAYLTTSNRLNNGLLGLNTSYRGPNGLGSYKTYGLGPEGNESSISLPHSRQEILQSDSKSIHEQAARKAYGFWKYSNVQGRSDYLERKGVSYYGIRFRSSEEYGNVAIVPMFDENGKLWSYQLLNPDGTKRHPKDACTKGLFHKLKELTNGKPIGIAESYVTAATCFELSGIPTVCAFSSENLVSVTKVLLSLYSASPIIIFADNDGHLIEKGLPNKGVLKAQEAKNVDQGIVSLVIPDFGDFKPSKEASDWNDLVCIKGRDTAKAQMSEMLIY